jgi:hypothetical protein
MEWGLSEPNHIFIMKKFKWRGGTMEKGVKLQIWISILVVMTGFFGPISQHMICHQHDKAEINI